MNIKEIILMIISWLSGLVFFIIGILNVLMVHPVPGILYMLFSLIFFPPVGSLLKKKASFSIPPAVKVIMAIIVMWFTLGVGDLAEIYGL